jgi:hypothetical protein
MSMVLILAMITPDVHQRIVETKGEYWGRMWNEKVEETFVRERDVLDHLDYRDLLSDVEDEDHLLHELVQGEGHGQVLVEGYEWTYGYPTYFDPIEVKAIHAKLKKLDDDWPLSEITEFFRRAAEANKGVIIGVT